MIFRVFTGPDSSNSLLAGQAGTKTYGWFSTVVLSDTSGFYVIVNAEKAIGVMIYYISPAMVPINSGKIALPLATSAYSETQPCIFGSTEMIIPIMDNVQSVAGTTAETLYLIVVTRATLASTK